MRILVAIDSFKGSLTSLDAGRAVARGIQASGHRDDVLIVPVSDGGEGLVEALHAATGGSIVVTPCRDPLGRPVMASWLDARGSAGWDAAIEVAGSSGMGLVSERDRDIMASATWGVGDQVRAALDRKASSILVGAGGSATCDGGAGMLHALGLRLLDARGQKLAPVASSLVHVRRLDASGLDPRLGESRVVVAGDVQNPMVGPEGAARIYGPQKGATASQVEKLEAGLIALSRAMYDSRGIDVAHLRGGGAAGGLAAALVVFCQARIRSGFEVIAEATRLEARVEEADLVITGEGCMDGQTLMGKLPSGVSGIARRRGKPVVAFCGRLEDPGGVLVPAHFDAIRDLVSETGSVQDAVRDAGPVLERVARKSWSHLRALAGG